MATNRKNETNVNSTVPAIDNGNTEPFDMDAYKAEMEAIAAEEKAFAERKAKVTAKLSPAKRTAMLVSLNNDYRDNKRAIEELQEKIAEHSRIIAKLRIEASALGGSIQDGRGRKKADGTEEKATE